MDRGAWRATVHGVVKESDTTERLTLTDGDKGYEKLQIREDGVEVASSTDKVIFVKQPHKQERKSLVEIGNEHSGAGCVQVPKQNSALSV